MKDSELDDLLREWKPDASVPASFQRQVWHRIEAAQASSIEGRVGVWWSDLLEPFMRPRLATVAAVLVAILGAGIGYSRAEFRLSGKRQSERTGADLYWGSINPLNSSRPQTR
ncbi:MAG: hypothetical protein K8R87_02345 [Verrucomicrobia bacterium]|nr:hypothetical protein [Verrucomicrobiota bacterium]